MAKGKYVEWLEPDGLLKIEGWARDGLTDEQIAHNMGIAYSTFRVWKDQFPALSATLKSTKEVVDREIENALYERAKGGKHEIKKVFKVKQEYFDEYGRKCYKEVLETRSEEIYIPGDTTAQIFWLKNRKPDAWRDKQEYVDTTALEKLDQILEETKNNANTEQETE